MLNRLKEKSRLLCSGLTILAFILWVLSSLQARGAQTSNMGDLGLFSILPKYFFLAFSMLVFTFFITLQLANKNRVLLLCQTILLILFLYFTPAIVEGTPRFVFSYGSHRAVDYISQGAQINPSKLWIHNWPGFSIFWSIFEQLTLIPGMSILLTYPTFYNILLLPPLFMFFRAVSKSSKLAWVAVWFVFLGNWVGQDYFSMQSFGFFGIAIMLSLLFKNMNQGMRTRQWSILLFLLSFLIVSTHFLSSLAILCVIIVLFLSKHLARYTLLTFFASLVTGWAVFGAGTYLSENLNRIIEQAFDLPYIFQVNLTQRISGSAGHILVTQMRVIYSVAIIAFALLCLVLAWRKRKLGIVEKRLLSVLVGFSLLLFAFSYGGELFMRLYMLSLLPFAYFISKTALKYKYILYALAIFLIIAAPSLHVIAHYGNEISDYVPYSENVGINFLYNNTVHGQVIGGVVRYGDFRDPNYHFNYSAISYRKMMDENSSSLLWTAPKELYEDRFVCISYGTTSVFSFFENNAAFIEDIQGNITQSTSYNLLYSNPSFSIYCSESKISR